MQLENAVALVTGAGSGIGRAIALELSRRGTRCILLGRHRDSLEGTRAEMTRPDLAWVLPLDLSDADARARISDSVMAMAGRLDLLVNNAGAIDAGPIRAQDEAAWRSMLEVNLLAPMSLSRHLFDLLKASGQGRIVNIGSMFGDIAFPYFAAYSASKFGLRGWSEALRREWADCGIGVTYCAPRGTRTPAADGFQAYARAYAMPLDAPEKIANRIVTGIAGDARDIYPAGPERLFLLLQRLLPARIDAALHRQTRAAQAALGLSLTP